MNAVQHYEYQNVIRINQLLPIIQTHSLTKKHNANFSVKGFLSGTFEPFRYPKMVKSKDNGFSKYGLFVESVLAGMLKKRYGKNFIGVVDKVFLELFPNDPETNEECSKTADDIVNLYPADNKTFVYYQRTIHYTTSHGTIQGHPDFMIARKNGKEVSIHILDSKVFWKFNARGKDGVKIKNQLACYYVLCAANPTANLPSIEGKNEIAVVTSIGLITPKCKIKVYRYSIPMKFGDEEAWLEVLKQAHIIHTKSATLRDIWEKRIAEYGVGKHIHKYHLPIFLNRGVPLQIMLHGNVQSKKQDGKLFQDNIPDLSGNKVYIHGPYNLNLGKREEYIWKSCVDYFKESVYYGFQGVVFHTGSNPDKKLGIRNMKANLQRILSEAQDIIQDSPFILETGCGEGNELLTSPEELSDFVSQFSTTKVALCVDTCHVYVAGYQPMDFIKRLGPEKQRIILIHFNGTTKEMGSCCDRHHYVGEYQNIPDSELVKVLDFSREYSIDCVIE